MLNSRHKQLKGSIHIYLGFGTIMLILFVLFVFIYSTNPQQAHQIAEGVSTLATAAKGK
ncbi:MAG: hypothetical protein AABX01_05035 [Candidatus Micrarchaeota archaeon]